MQLQCIQYIITYPSKIARKSKVLVSKLSFVYKNVEKPLGNLGRLIFQPGKVLLKQLLETLETWMFHLARCFFESDYTPEN